MKTIGTMRTLDERCGAIRVEDLYATGIDDLWEACTNPARLARWIADVSGDLEVGGNFYATFTSSGAGRGHIDACEPPRHLLLTMLTGTADQQQIEAWLTPEGEQTRLVVEHRGLPVAELHIHGAGWQAHLEDLGRSLLGEPSVWRARWTELTPIYERMNAAVLHELQVTRGRELLAEDDVELGGASTEVTAQVLAEWPA